MLKILSLAKDKLVTHNIFDDFSKTELQELLPSNEISTDPTAQKILDLFREITKKIDLLN